MINGKKVIAIIPARGGSKSIPYKNIKLLLGKPLIAWAIEAAQQTKAIDRIAVSTDDKKIAEVAYQFGAEVMDRPEHLAQDDSLPIDVVKNIIQDLKKSEDGSTYMVYLEPTCPLREPEDINKTLEMLANNALGVQSVATFVEASLNPHRAWKMTQGSPQPFIDHANPWLPRQKLPEAYQLNGAVYSFLIDMIKEESRYFLQGKLGAVIMPKERSVDIDDEFDFFIAESLMRRRFGNA